jgi:hypothetical protein
LLYSRITDGRKVEIEREWEPKGGLLERKKKVVGTKAISRCL